MRRILGAAGGRDGKSSTRRFALFRRVLFALLIACAGGALFPAGPGPVWAETVNAGALSMPAQEGGVLAIAGAGGASLYETPGDGLIRALPAGSVLTAVGRSADNAWVLVVTSDDKAGWAETTQVVMFGIDELPVMIGEAAAASSAGVIPAAPAAPVALPTPTPTRPPTATPTPSPTPTMTPTPLPTSTPTLAPPTRSGSGASMRPGASVGSGQGSQVAVVRAGGAELLTVPGGVALSQLATGSALTVWGRSEDSRWLVAVTAAGDSGWVDAAKVVAFNLSALPVVPAGSTPIVAGQPEQPGIPTAAVSTPEPAEEPVQEQAPAARVTVSAPIPVDAGVRATVAITDSRLNVRSGPDVSYRIVVKALPGETFVAVGRNATSTWIEISGGSLGSDTGWVAAEFMQVSAPLEQLPVTDVGATIAPPAFTPLAAPPLPAVSRTQGGSLLAAAPSAPGALSGILTVQRTSTGEIFVVDLASGAERVLTSGFDPAISPDGKTVAFVRANGEHGLYLIDIDGRNERRIYLSGERLKSPAWSPDGKYIVFSRRSGDFECRDVGFGICLSDNPFLDSFPMVTKPEYGLSRVDVNGQDFRDLPALTSAVAPSWSTGGVVYQSNTGLEITADEPGVQTRLLLSAPYYQDPAWQPGGDRIVFQSREGTHWEIFTVNADGTGLSALTRPVTTLVDELPSNVAPAWSPDGQWIVYLSNRADDNSAGPWRLWVMRADGSGQRPLGLGPEVDYSFGSEQAVAWGVGTSG